MSFVPPHFKLQEVTEYDIIIASLAFGFTLGFGQLTAWNAMRQSWMAYKNTGLRVLRNIYIWMVWGEIIVCLAFAIICFLHLRGVIKPCLAFYFIILTIWALQVHFLLQIIINRCRIVAHDKKFMGRLKVGVAIFITAINISVYNIWIPARLQISERYIHTNEWWDRCEKVLYMLTDGFLNMFFIRVVQRGLVRNGLTKYRGLVHFNMFIIGFSLSMDVLIITMMSLPNTFVYMMFHPLAYIVKLNIELSMADLIGRIARNRDHSAIEEITSGTDSNKLSYRRSRGTSASGTITSNRQHDIGFGGWNRRSTKTAGVELNDITRPDAVYTVNATANTYVESGLHNSKDIYTTREFRVDFEDVAPQTPGSVADSHAASTSRKENEDTSLLQSDQKWYAIQDDVPL